MVLTFQILKIVQTRLARNKKASEPLTRYSDCGFMHDVSTIDQSKLVELYNLVNSGSEARRHQFSKLTPCYVGNRKTNKFRFRSSNLRLHPKMAPILSLSCPILSDVCNRKFFALTGVCGLTKTEEFWKYCLYEFDFR